MITSSVFVVCIRGGGGEKAARRINKWKDSNCPQSHLKLFNARSLFALFLSLSFKVVFSISAARCWSTNFPRWIFLSPLDPQFAGRRRRSSPKCIFTKLVEDHLFILLLLFLPPPPRPIIFDCVKWPLLHQHDHRRLILIDAGVSPLRSSFSSGSMCRRDSIFLAFYLLAAARPLGNLCGPLVMSH